MSSHTKRRIAGEKCVRASQSVSRASRHETPHPDIGDAPCASQSVDPSWLDGEGRHRSPLGRGEGGEQAGARVGRLLLAAILISRSPRAPIYEVLGTSIHDSINMLGRTLIIYSNKCEEAIGGV